MKGRDTLDVFDFGLLFQALAHSLKVGTLRVTAGGREKFICLNRGRVDAIYTSRSRFRLGRVLYNLGAVSRRTLRQVLEEQREQGPEERVPIGEALEDRGFVNADQINTALRYQMIEEMLEIFFWEDVRYEFFRGPPEKALSRVTEDLTRVGGTQEADDLLLEVTRVIDDIRKHDEVVPSAKDVYVPGEDVETILRRPDLPPRSDEFLALLDGLHDVTDILRKMRLNRLEVMELFYYFRVRELIQPLSGVQLLALAENEHDGFTPDKMARLYERIRELGVEDSETTLRIAEAYEKLGDAEGAAENYRFYAAKALAEGDVENAELAAAQAVELRPNSRKLRRFRIGILRRLGKTEEAVADLHALAGMYRRHRADRREELVLRRALTLAPDDKDLAVEHAEVLHRLGRTRDAGNLCVKLADRLWMGWEFESAEEAQRTAVRMDPRSIRYRRGLVRLLGEKGEADRALAAFHELMRVLVERLQEHPSQAIRGLSALRDLLGTLGAEDSPAMMVLAAAFVEHGAVDPAAQALTAAAAGQAAAGRLDAAAETLEQAVELRPDDQDLRQRVAAAYAEIGKLERAVEHLAFIADRQRDRGLNEMAEKTLWSMLTVQPYSPRVLEELADLLSAQGKSKEAAKCLARIGHLHQGADRVADAITYYDRACGLDPSNAEHARALADSLSDVLEVDRSVESYRRLSEMLRKRGENAGAINAGLRILDYDPEDEEVLGSVRTAYDALGAQIEESVE